MVEPRVSGPKRFVATLWLGKGLWLAVDLSGFSSAEMFISCYMFIYFLMSRFDASGVPSDEHITRKWDGRAWPWEDFLLQQCGCPLSCRIEPVNAMTRVVFCTSSFFCVLKQSQTEAPKHQRHHHAKQTRCNLFDKQPGTYLFLVQSNPKQDGLMAQDTGYTA